MSKLSLHPGVGVGVSLVYDFVIFGISMGGFLSQTQCAQFAKLGVFWKIWPKKAPNLF